MDSDNCKKKEIGDSQPDSSDILQPVRVRRSICSSDEMDRVLLDYGFNFLLPFGIILWCLLASFVID